jgi:cell division protein ZapA (FtsZ GTPase activity inhibitor)
VSGERQAVRVVIGGEEFTVRSELPPEYTREVAAYLDRTLGEIRASAPSVEAHKVALLAGLAVTDELFQARRGDADHGRRLHALAEELTRLLPPTRRGAAAG